MSNDTTQRGVPDCALQDRRKQPSMAKTITSSVLASLIVAGLINFIFFISMLSKLQVEVEYNHRRLISLELETREHLKDNQRISVELAKLTTVLESIIKELASIHKETNEIRQDYKPLIRNNYNK